MCLALAPVQLRQHCLCPPSHGMNCHLTKCSGKLYSTTRGVPSLCTNRKYYRSKNCNITQKDNC
jgi:hypothetical protein